MKAEGWYVDPYGAHEARWFSDGSATALVRDGSDESHDAPPSPEYDEPLQELPIPEVGDGEDLRRADEPEPPDQIQAVLDKFGSSGPNF